MKKPLMIVSSILILLIVLSLIYYKSKKSQDVAGQKAIAHAEAKGTASKEGSQEIFNFVSDYIKSLSYFKSAQAKLEEVQNNKNYKDDIEMGASFMNGFKLANKDLTAAKHLLEKHKNSDNQYLKKATTTAEMAYNRLMQLNDTSADLLAKIMDKQGHFNLGKYRLEAGAIPAEKQGLLDALVYASNLVARALVDENPDDSGNLNYLVLTSKNREELINSLDQTFGEGAKESKPSTANLDTPAAALRNILAGKHRSADERLAK